MDETFERVLIDYDGRSSVFSMGKIGILWELDRRTGAFRAAHDLGYQDQGTIDPKTGQLMYRPSGSRRKASRSVLPERQRRQDVAGHGLSPADAGRLHSALSALCGPRRSSCPSTSRSRGAAAQAGVASPVFTFIRKAPTTSATLPRWISRRADTLAPSHPDAAHHVRC